MTADQMSSTQSLLQNAEYLSARSHALLEASYDLHRRAQRVRSRSKRLCNMALQRHRYANMVLAEAMELTDGQQDRP